MRPDRRAALGIMLVGGGWTFFATRTILALGPEAWVLLGLGVGLGHLAAGGAFALLPRTRSLVAVAYGSAAMCAVAFLALNLGGVNVISNALTAIGLLQAAWVVALWSAEDGRHTPRRMAALQLTYVATGAAGLGYVISNLASGNPLAFVAPLLILGGSVLAVRSLGAMRVAPSPAARVVAAEA